MGKEKKKAPEPPGAPAWMVTYGDLMTLLLTFFVIIVSFSTMEINKFKSAVGALRGALQPWNPAPGGPKMIKTTSTKDAGDFRKIDSAAEEVLRLLEEENMSSEVEVQQVGTGVRIIFSDPVLFDQGKDVYRPGIEPMMVKLVELSKRVGSEEVMIEGHTDDTPIHTAEFPSNWELSTARALRVLKSYQANGYPAKQLIAVGFGEYRPRKALPPDASVEEKGVNRRVEIYLNIKSDKSNLFQQIQSSAHEDTWGD